MSTFRSVDEGPPDEEELEFLQTASVSALLERYETYAAAGRRLLASGLLDARYAEVARQELAAGEFGLIALLAMRRPKARAAFHEEDQT